MIYNCGLTKHYDDAKCDIDNANGGDDGGGDDYAMVIGGGDYGADDDDGDDDVSGSNHIERVGA